MTKFEFVVSDGAPKRASSAARSHAVKSGLQRKKQSPAATGSRESQLTIRQKDSLKGRFRITSKTSEESKKKPAEKRQPDIATEPKLLQEADKTSITDNEDASVLDYYSDMSCLPSEPAEQSVLCATWEMVRSPSQGWGDPFNTFTVPMNNEVDKLMKFWIARFDLQITMAYVQKQWWGYAISDPLVMHTTLGLSAATWAMFLTQPSKVVAEGKKQKLLALQAIRERIAESKGRNEALVGAIANLANMEGVEGDFNVARVHLKGLDVLVQERGGYPAYKDNRNVAGAVTWSDLQAAAGLDEKPLFPLILPLESITIPPTVLAAAETPSLSHLRVFESSLSDTTVRFTFSLIRQAYYALKRKEMTPDDLRVLINAVDYHLAHSLASPSLSDPARLLLTAARIFMYIVVRETTPMCQIPRLIVDRVHKQLRKCIGPLSANPECWPGLLWCTTIGAASSWRSGENWEFYSSTLSKLVAMMNLSSTVEVEFVLRRFAYDDFYPGQFLHTYGPNLFVNAIDPELDALSDPSLNSSLYL